MSLAETDSVSAAPTAAPRRYAGAGWRQYRSELRLVFGRRRNMWLLAGLAALPIVIGLVVYFFGNEVPDGHGPTALIDRITNSGVFLAIMALIVSVPLLLPLVTGVVAGDSIAGEAQAGTLRYVLTLPVARTRLLLTKAAAVVTFLFAGVGVMCAIGLLVGGVLFGWGGPTLLSGDRISFAEGVGRLAVAGLYAAISLVGLTGVGLFISTLTEVPLAAMAATVIVSIVSTVLDQLPQLAAIHGGLLTDHMLDFIEVLRLQLDVSALWPGVAVQLAWAALFGALAWARLVTKDVTC